jgi:ferritin-like metal-binding protein YciE
MSEKELQEQVIKYLTDAHGLEQHAIKALETGAEAVQYPALAEAMREHLGETRGHAQLVDERLEQLGANPSTIKDVAQKGMAIMANLGLGVMPDTTGKVAIEVFTFEHMEIAAYRTLRAVAERAGDEETVRIADQILAQEEEAAEKVSGMLEEAALIGLQEKVSG